MIIIFEFDYVAFGRLFSSSSSISIIFHYFFGITLRFHFIYHWFLHFFFFRYFSFIDCSFDVPFSFIIFLLTLFVGNIIDYSFLSAISIAGTLLSFSQRCSRHYGSFMGHCSFCGVLFFFSFIFRLMWFHAVGLLFWHSSSSLISIDVECIFDFSISLLDWFPLVVLRRLIFFIAFFI